MPTDLPIELWGIILGHAVHIDGALETIMSTHFQWLDWRWNEREKYEKSLVTRKSLIRVCKAWYWTAMELLYEDIRLNTLDKMKSLHIAISTSQQSGGLQDYCRKTKRLDFPDYRLIDDELVLMTLLIKYCPNLRILRFHHDFIAPDLTGLQLPKLQYTFLQFAARPFQRNEWQRLNFSHLDTLFLIPSVAYNQVFANLTALEVFFDSGESSSILAYSFPNLRHLTLANTYYFSDHELQILEQFIQGCGHRLLSLKLSAAETYQRIQRLLFHTPNIRELIICPLTVQASYNEFVHNNVTHIGLACCMDNDWMALLMDPFLDVSRFPNVNCIRLVDKIFKVVTSAPRIEMFRTWFRSNPVVQRGICYEFDEGRLISDVVNRMPWA